MINVVIVFASLVELGRATPFAVAGTLLSLVVFVGALAALRLRAPPWLVTCLTLGLGLCLAAGQAVGAGSEGVGSLFWMVLAPIIALPVGGKKAGWITLGVTSIVVTASATAIQFQWITPFADPGRPFEMQLISLLGILFAAFFLTRAYEVETQASIDALKAQNEALHVAQSLAEQGNRTKSEFIATISHEIRTPLNGVTGMATLLRGETDPERLAEGLRVIQQSADTLLAVINDVLDFSKIESNQLELEAIPVSVERELRVVTELLAPAATQNGNELSLTIDAALPAWIRGDPTRLRQVVMNLVSNAVKFTSDGKVSVRGRLLEGRLSIEVTDTGIGMSSEVRSMLFAPFVQADASTTRRFGGTGLGLVIARRIVEAMGGTLSLESEPGRGSSFVVSLPLVPVEPAPVSEQAPAAPPIRRRVLVVEDNPINRLVVVRLLQKLGHDTTVASDGMEGLTAAAQGGFDLVLMDCHMPVMDGFDATRQIRARGDATPVWALTAAASLEDRARCLQAGMNGVLTKPLRIERLAEVLAQLDATGAHAS